jgi:hypothetical protein
MIKIKKDINVFGFKMFKGGKLYPPRDITNTGSGQFLISYTYKDGCSGAFPILAEKYNKTTIEFLDETCKLNTGHSTYLEYNDFINDKKFRRK